MQCVKNFDEIYAKDRSRACWIFPLTLAQNICDTSYHQSYISNKWFFNWTSNFRARNDAGTQTPNQHTRGILGTSMSMSTECDVMWRAQWGLQNEQAKKQSHWCGVNHSNLLDLIVYRWFNKISAWWNGVFSYMWWTPNLVDLGWSNKTLFVGMNDCEMVVSEDLKCQDERTWRIDCSESSAFLQFRCSLEISIADFQGFFTIISQHSKLFCLSVSSFTMFLYIQSQSLSSILFVVIPLV